jgi:hypothetical protein
LACFISNFAKRAIDSGGGVKFTEKGDAFLISLLRMIIFGMLILD